MLARISVVIVINIPIGRCMEILVLVLIYLRILLFFLRGMLGRVAIVGLKN